MDKRIIILIVGLLIAFGFEATGELVKPGTKGNAGQPERSPGQCYVAGEVIIKMAPDSDEKYSWNGDLWRKTAKARRFRSTAGSLKQAFSTRIKSIKTAGISDYYVVKTETGCDVKTLKAELLRDRRVVDASLNYIASISATVPDDPLFQYQYGLHNTGQSYMQEPPEQGTEDSDINAPEGWDRVTGSEDIVIAILDSGIAAEHEDLANRVIPGYNFISDSYDVSDDNGHGTFVASIAAAETNNGVGMAGVSWNSRIMAVKVVDSEGFGSYLTIAAGIRYAADNGADIINLSLGGETPSFILEDACSYAFNQGAVLVVASGNNGAAVSYPAAYDDYCLAVAATDANDATPDWSNNGPQVDVAAPGEWVFGAMYEPDDPATLDGYGWDSGTSFAAPYVSGAVALLLSYKSYLNNIQIMNLIKYTADDVNNTEYPGVDDYIGYGRLNLKTLLGPYAVGD